MSTWGRLLESGESIVRRVKTSFDLTSVAAQARSKQGAKAKRKTSGGTMAAIKDSKRVGDGSGKRLDSTTARKSNGPADAVEQLTHAVTTLDRDAVTDNRTDKQRDDKPVAKKEQVSKVVQRTLTNILTEMMDDCLDIVGAMVSSADGLAWAQKLQPGLDHHRFAAMSSALLALGDNVIKESHDGSTQNVLIESDKGNVFVMHIGKTLLLTVFTRASSNLGMSLAHARRAIEEISELEVDNMYM
jgi:predicted regulator of Ras-like GTPase activity (Roadblock/LC7/MglB family)